MAKVSTTSRGRTPRSSSASETNEDTTRHPTPHNALQRLVDNLIDPETPGQFTSSRRQSVRRTPRAGGANAAPTTPHALRAMQRRAAARTPGRDRRKSGRVQRETPIDILKNLGRALAPTSKPIESSPPEEEPEPEPDEIDELDREPLPSRPRFSLPMRDMIAEEDEDEDGSPEIQPPRLSLPFDDEDVTTRSIEVPRRMRPPEDEARRSFGSIRFSENFGEMTQLDDSEGVVGDVTAPPEDDYDNDTGPVFDAGGETEDLRRFNLDFSFPTPEVTGVQEAGHDEDNFMLDAGLQDVPSLASDSGGEGTGFEVAMQEDTHPRPAVGTESPQPTTREKKSKQQQKLSRHGIPVPRLPSGIVKKLATRFSKTGNSGKRLNKETLAVIEQASEWYFAQASEDLSAYSKHAGRKTIDETDVLTLMRRQRFVGKNASVFALAQKHLPKELLQDVRLPKR